jgi:hypothetical protein
VAGFINNFQAKSGHDDVTTARYFVLINDGISYSKEVYLTEVINLQIRLMGKQCRLP